MQVESQPRANAPLGGLLSIVLRALFLIILAGLIVAAVKVLPNDTKNQVSTAAVTGAARVAQRATPQISGEQVSAAGPRVVQAGPVAPSPVADHHVSAQRDNLMPSAGEGDSLTREGRRSGSIEASAADRMTLRPVPEVAKAGVSFELLSTTAKPVAAPAAKDQENFATLPETAEPPGSPGKSLVDINTATLDELNDLRGVGRIGRAIIRRRPYASPEDLLRKRVLNHTTFNRIKDQITAR